MKKEELDSVNLEVIHTLESVLILVDFTELELQSILQNTAEKVDELSDQTINAVEELNHRLYVLKEAGNNIFERKQRLEHKKCDSCNEEDKEGFDDLGYTKPPKDRNFMYI
jgi:formylmethanofuran dehydrogenase subunit E